MFDISMCVCSSCKRRRLNKIQQKMGWLQVDVDDKNDVHAQHP